MRSGMLQAYLILAACGSATAGHADGAGPAPAPAARSTRIGVNVIWDGRGGTDSIPDPALADRLMHDVLDSGAKVVRIGVSWASIEPQPGVYLWEKTDKLVDFLVGHGIEPLACFCTTPFWASDLAPEQKAVFEERGWQGLLGVVPPDRRHAEAFRTYAAACAGRYRGRIRLYEFWNEEEGMGMPIPFRNEEGAWDIRLGGDAETYLFWLGEASQAIKQGNPEARVAIGGMERWKENRFLRALLAAGAAGTFDAVALHPYGTPDTDYDLDWAWVRDTARILDEHGFAQIPIWITECGWLVSDKSGSIDEQRQAELVARMFDGLAAHARVELLSFHTLNDWGGSLESAARMGLVAWDGRRRPAFSVFATKAPDTRSRDGAPPARTAPE